MEVTSLQYIEETNCEYGPQPFGFGSSTSSLSLMRVSPDGGVGFSSLASSSVSGLTAGEVIPDGNGGVLVSYFDDNPPVGSSSGLIILDTTTGAASTLSSFSQADYGANLEMVLGDNGTAFVTDGNNVVAFNVDSLQPGWTYSSQGGFLSLVAATSGSGVAINDSQQGAIQLDSSGNASAPVSSLQGDQYFGNALWVGVPGDPVLAAFQGTFVDWIESAWAFVFGTKTGGHTQPRPDFELNWCQNGLCASMKDPKDGTTPDQDVTFSVQASDPPHNTTNLNSSQINIIQLNAANAFKLAFAPYKINVGIGHQGTNTVYVVGERYQGICGGTPPLAVSYSVVYYPANASWAQDAVNDTAGTPTDALVAAIGEGVGNNAAHEIAHQLVNARSKPGNIINQMDLDDASTDTYNGMACDYTAPWVYTGIGGPDGTTSIHWESDAAQSLKNLFGARN
jgi:hypothetical protein